MNGARHRSPAAGALALGAAVAIGLVVWWAGRGDADLVARAMQCGEREVTAAAAAPAQAVVAPVVAAENASASSDLATREAATVLDSIADPAEVARLVDDLRDDGVRGNGTAAFRSLCALPRGRLAAVEAALQSRDEQQAAFAGGVLRERCRLHGERPSPSLLAASVAALCRSSRIDLVGTAAWPPAETSLRFLVDHVEAAREPLERALTAGDDQQRLFAAYLLADVADERLAPYIVRELARHLEHNEIRGDALLAANGLYRLGAVGLPAVGAWRQGLDEQGRALLELVDLDVRSPPRDRAALRARADRHRVTTVYHDPAVEFDLWRSRVPLW